MRRWEVEGRREVVREGGEVKKIKPPDYLQMRERESSLSFPLKSSDYTNANQTDKHKRPDK